MINIVPWTLNLGGAPPPGPGATRFHVYRAPLDGGPIDYGSAVATTSDLTWTSPPLSFPGAWSFAVRAFNDYGEEKNLDCSATIRLDAGGVDVTRTPSAPTWLSASAEAAGAVRLRWRPGEETAFDGPGRPTGYRVYHGAGSVDYGTVAATVPHGGPVLHEALIEGLVHGVVRTFAVRAYNDSGESGSALVDRRPDSVGPASVLDFAIQAVV